MKALFASRPVLSFVLLTYALTATAWGMLIARHGTAPIDALIVHGDALFFIYVGAGAPTLVALLLVAVNQGRAGLRDLGRRIVLVRFPVSAWLLAACLPVSLAVLATFIYGLTSGSSGYSLGPVVLPAWYQLVPASALVVFFAGPLCEETGWRGYLQPLLLQRHSQAVTAILLGSVWCFWHIPLSFTPGTTPPLHTASAWLVYWLDTIVVSAVMLAIVVRAHGSLLAAMVFHWMSNIAFSHIVQPIFPSAPEEVWSSIQGIYLVLLFLVAISLMGSFLFGKPDRVSAPK